MPLLSTIMVCGPCSYVLVENNAVIMSMILIITMMIIMVQKYTLI